MILSSLGLWGNYSSIIADPVHGSIAMFEHEMAMIDNPLFQRLRQIKQNDVLEMVFPGATHCRFTHSIGCMHLASQMLDSIIKNADKNPNIENQSLKPQDYLSLRYINICLRLAALFHDTGHMAFSHLFEWVGNVQEIFNQEKNTIFASCEQYIDWNKSKHIAHEHFSIRSANSILRTYFKQNKNSQLCLFLQQINCSEDEFIQDVISIMENGKKEPSPAMIRQITQLKDIFIKNNKTLPNTEKLFIKFLSSIISGELDADKMDYMMRDSYFSGCKYGIFNYEHLISSICLGYNIVDNEPWIGMTIKSKGVAAFEDFVHSRFMLYKQIYNHKTNIGFKIILRQAIEEVYSQEEIKDFISDVNRFVYFTDSFFWEKFRNHAITHPQSACHALLNRKKLKHLMECPFVNNDDIAGKILFLTKKCKENGMSQDTVVISERVNSKFSAIDKKYDEMLVLFIDKITKQKSLKKISEVTNFFEKFKNSEVVHFYQKAKF